MEQRSLHCKRYANIPSLYLEVIDFKIQEENFSLNRIGSSEIFIVYDGNDTDYTAIKENAHILTGTKGHPQLLTMCFQNHGTNGTVTLLYLYSKKSTSKYTCNMERNLTEIFNVILPKYKLTSTFDTEESFDLNHENDGNRIKKGNKIQAIQRIKLTMECNNKNELK